MVEEGARYQKQDRKLEMRTGAIFTWRVHHYGMTGMEVHQYGISVNDDVGAKAVAYI